MNGMDAFMTQQLMCRSCSRINYHQYLEQLRMMKRFYRDRGVVPAENSIRFYWHTDEHCRMSMGCNRLSVLNKEASALSREMDGYLTAVVDNKKFYHETLRFLQGYFPNVYRELEREYHTRRAKTKN